VSGRRRKMNKWLAYVPWDDVPQRSFLVVAPADWGQDRVVKALSDMGLDGVYLRPHDAHANIDSLCGLVKVVYLSSWKIDVQRVGSN
jgi:hypothetical protein